MEIDAHPAETEPAAPVMVREELRLLHAVQRALSTPKGRLVLRLPLSQLSGSRPHQRQIARVILDKVAQHHRGETFVLGCGDMLLLCQPVTAGAADPAAHPAALPHILARLFRQARRTDDPLIDIWALERDGATALAYATARAA